MHPSSKTGLLSLRLPRHTRRSLVGNQTIKLQARIEASMASQHHREEKLKLIDKLPWYLSSLVYCGVSRGCAAYWFHLRL